MKIAYATLHDPSDVRSGSGTAFFFSRELERLGHVVHRLGPLRPASPLVTRLLARLARAAGRRYRSLQDPFVGRRIGRLTSAVCDGLDFDVLLTNDYCVAAYAGASRPLALYSDAIFPSDFETAVNPRFDGLSSLSVRLCQRINRLGLARVERAIFPTRWALEEALRYDPELRRKLRVVPFGANLEDPGRDIQTARNFRSVAARGRVELLFVGRNWRAKGGHVALATACELRLRGRDVVLHLVGSEPSGDAHSGFTRVHGLLDKRLPRDRCLLDRLYRQADALILPSRGEGFGIAAVEAAAYGMPVLGYDTVGLNEAVRHQETGVLLPVGEDGPAFADIIEGWFAEPGAYDRLAAGARRHFERDTNWTVAARRVVAELASLLDPKEPDAAASREGSR